MTSITPITTGFHEITPFTPKSDWCYNHPPVLPVFRALPVTGSDRNPYQATI